MKKESGRRLQKSRFLLIAMTGLIVGAIVFGITAVSQKHPPTVPGIPDLAVWRAKIAANPQQAYTDFKEEYKDVPFGTQHDASHIIGALLYDSLGLSGIAICDPSFAFGCYHGFFGRAISDKGVGVVPELAQSCRTQFGANSTGCEHGIGHGIMEYLGANQLLHGLDLCKQTNQLEPLYGCTSGLFMEYNTSIVFEKRGVFSKSRVMDTQHPLAPCNTIVPSQYRTSCYFEIALWWQGYLGNDNEKIGNLCMKADTQDERDACAQGWGTVVAENAHHDPAQARKICNLIHNKRGADMCAFGVASRFTPAGYPDAAQQTCSTISDMKLQSRCVHFSDIRP